MGDGDWRQLQTSMRQQALDRFARDGWTFFVVIWTDVSDTICFPLHTSHPDWLDVQDCTTPLIYERVISLGASWCLAGDRPVFQHCQPHPSDTLWYWNQKRRAWDGITRHTVFRITHVEQVVLIKTAYVIEAPLLALLLERMYEPVRPPMNVLDRYFSVLKKAVQGRPDVIL